MLFRVSALTLGVALSLAPSPARAATIAETLSKGRAQYVGQEYEKTIRLLAPLVKSPMATISQKIDAFELIGLSYLILGEKKRAHEAFENLLALDPSHMLRDPSGSPKLRRFFETVKERFVPGYRRGAKVELVHDAPDRSRAGRRIEFAVRVVRGGAQLKDVVLYWRRGGLVRYRRLPMELTGSSYIVSFFLPRDTVGYSVEYYVEAQNARGQALARVAAPDQPLRVEVRGLPRGGGGPTGGPRFYQRWWFWTAIGAAVVGGTIAGIASSVETAPTGSLGKFTLP